jgi:hypothetical protein
MIVAVLMLSTLASIYCFWVRPVLRLRPSLRELYARSDSFVEAVRLKFAGLKQKLVSVAVVAASLVVTIYDFLVPIVGSVDVTTITDKVPGWAWPLVMIVLTAVLQWLRNLADRRQAEAAKE